MHTQLYTLSLVQNLSTAGQQLFMQQVISSDCPAGSTVLYKGQAVSGAYLVISGRLRVYSIGPDGNEATLYFLSAGEPCIFALNSLFNDLRYPAWVQAETTTKVAVIPGALFRQLFLSERVIQDITVRALSTLVFRLMHELENVHNYHLDQRLASLLLTHASHDGEIRMTQQKIAQHLGSTREVIARLLKNFVALGFIKTARGCIKIYHLDALEQFIR